MPIIAFNYTKILGERSDRNTGNVTVKNAVNLTEAAKIKLEMGPGTQDVLRVEFQFTTNYEPDKGKIVLEGGIIYLDPPAKIEALAKAWQKDKQLPKDISRVLINHILSKCNVEAILMSRELNLPSPIEMPQVSAK
jgi:hypothetical protein